MTGFLHAVYQVPVVTHSLNGRRWLFLKVVRIWCDRNCSPRPDVGKPGSRRVVSGANRPVFAWFRLCAVAEAPASGSGE